MSLGLTEREKQVLILYAQGGHRRSIATLLYPPISPDSVDTIRKRILKKTKAISLFQVLRRTWDEEMSIRKDILPSQSILSTIQQVKDLTPGQTEVLETFVIMDDPQNPQIAGVLGIAEQTVRNQLHRASITLGAKGSRDKTGLMYYVATRYCQIYPPSYDEVLHKLKQKGTLQSPRPPLPQRRNVFAV